MKWAVVTVIVLMTASLIVWVRGNESFHFAQMFPFLGGYDPGIYDAGALIIVFITAAGLIRLARRGRRDE